MFGGREMDDAIPEEDYSQYAQLMTNRLRFTQSASAVPDNAGLFSRDGILRTTRSEVLARADICISLDCSGDSNLSNRESLPGGPSPAADVHRQSECFSILKTPAINNRFSEKALLAGLFADNDIIRDSGLSASSRRSTSRDSQPYRNVSKQGSLASGPIPVPEVHQQSDCAPHSYIARE